jgi:hemerythrin
MDKYVWKESYGVGNDIIDAQHKKFFELANRLLAAAALKDSSHETLDGHVMTLANYAYHHLATEEQYLLQGECAGGAAHVEIHNAFRAEAMRRIEDLRKVSVDRNRMAAEMADFAGSWLVNHILVVDKGSADCFKLPLPPGATLEC